MATSGNRNGGVPAPVNPPSEETLKRFLAIQEGRLALDLKQADITLKELEHNQKVADKSIDAQAADRKDDRQVFKQMQLHRLIFAGIIVVACLAFVLVALHMGKDAIILDTLKILMGFVGGWGASHAWSRYSRSGRNTKEADEDD